MTASWSDPGQILPNLRSSRCTIVQSCDLKEKATRWTKFFSLHCWVWERRWFMVAGHQEAHNDDHSADGDDLGGGDGDG